MIAACLSRTRREDSRGRRSCCLTKPRPPFASDVNTLSYLCVVVVRRSVSVLVLVLVLVCRRLLRGCTVVVQTSTSLVRLLPLRDVIGGQVVVQVIVAVHSTGSARTQTSLKEEKKHGGGGVRNRRMSECLNPDHLCSRLSRSVRLSSRNDTPLEVCTSPKGPKDYTH